MTKRSTDFGEQGFLGYIESFELYSLSELENVLTDMLPEEQRERGIQVLTCGQHPSAKICRPYHYVMAGTRFVCVSYYGEDMESFGIRRFDYKER